MAMLCAKNVLAGVEGREMPAELMLNPSTESCDALNGASKEHS